MSDDDTKHLPDRSVRTPVTALSASRRRVVAALGSLSVLGATAGCVADDPESGSRTGSPTDDRGSATATTSPGGDTPASVKTVSVADFVIYPLSGTHPHVHRRSGTQYVIVRLDTSLSDRTVRDRLTLELDGEEVPLASRQPVPWETPAVDVALAVPKDATHDGGRILFDGETLGTLPSDVTERLNAPPVFEVGEPSVSPDEVADGARATATVEVGVRNVGDGAGAFGASLSGNYVSGSNTVTRRIDAGAAATVSASTGIIGEGDAATVRLDWGSGRWSADVPVVEGVGTGEGTATGTAEAFGVDALPWR